MELTKEQCDEALTRLLRPYFAKVDVQNVYHSINKGHSIEEDSNLLTSLIMEHFGNQSLYLNQLEKGKPYWDNKEKQWCLYVDYHVFLYEDGYSSMFEINRFYKKEVKEND